MKVILKTTMKLLFRNKGFWFFMIAAPLLSIIMLNIKVADSSYYAAGVESENLLELEGPKEKVAYFNNGNGALIIKVYDASGSSLSEYLLKKLAGNGMFKILRAKTEGMTDEDFKERLKTDGLEDRMAAAMFIRSDFDTKIVAGDSKGAFEIALLSDDGRWEMLKTEAENISGKMIAAAALSGRDDVKILETLEEEDKYMMVKEVINHRSPDERTLTKEQNNEKTRMGYVFAFLTLGFMFCGIFVAHTVIQEQKEQVITRIKLTNTGSIKYFFAKFLAGVIISLLQTFILGLGLLFADLEQSGMTRVEILILTFLLGLIFCSISLLLGILFEEVMTANVVAFTIWSLSSMLSGLYFPLNATTKLIKVISSIMPQKWFMEGTEMIFTGDKSAYVMLLCIVAAYLTFVISLGGLGLKMKKAEA